MRRRFPRPRCVPPTSLANFSKASSGLVLVCLDTEMDRAELEGGSKVDSHDPCKIKLHQKCPDCDHVAHEVRSPVHCQHPVVVARLLQSSHSHLPECVAFPHSLHLLRWYEDGIGCHLDGEGSSWVWRRIVDSATLAVSGEDASLV